MYLMYSLLWTKFDNCGRSGLEGLKLLFGVGILMGDFSKVFDVGENFVFIMLVFF